LNLWKDIKNLPPSAPNMLYAVIETPRGSKNRYVYDTSSETFGFRVVSYSSSNYPADCGIIPQTLGNDGNPLNIMVLIDQHTFSGCVIKIKPIGILKMKNRNRRGFTFIEIMVVVVILAILAGLVIPRFLGRAEQARSTKTVVQIRELMSALDLYHLDNSFYPTTEQGLEALVEKPSSEPLPRAWKKYMDKIPKDAWGKDYIYICPGAHAAFDLKSLGPDGEESEDDIDSWDLPEN